MPISCFCWSRYEFNVVVIIIWEINGTQYLQFMQYAMPKAAYRTLRHPYLPARKRCSQISK